jgi:curved DNA-binding protein CbpA
MIDYFALLEQTRRPWLDPEKLKEKYHELARRAQPDQNLNEAYRVLLDPKLRLQHLLALEGAPAAATSEIPSELSDLFMAIAPVLNKIDIHETSRIDELIIRVKKLQDETLIELREIDAAWRDKLTELNSIHGRISYLTRWLTLLEERRFQLST